MSWRQARQHNCRHNWETLYLYANPIEFIKITYPTDTFRKIIGDIVSTMSNASGSKTFIQMLNLEMGSGKTHLLTLLYHLFFTLRCKYNIPLDDDIKRKLREFDYYDFKDRRIVVLPIDFRTKNFKTQLRLGLSHFAVRERIGLPRILRVG